MAIIALLNRKITNLTMDQLERRFCGTAMLIALIALAIAYIHHSVLQKQADTMLATERITVETTIPYPDGWLRVFLRCEYGTTEETVILDVRPDHPDNKQFSRLPAGTKVTFDKELRPHAPYLKVLWPTVADYLNFHSGEYPYPIKEEVFGK